MTYYRYNGACIMKKVTAQAWGGWTDDMTGYFCITDQAITITKLRFYVTAEAYDPAATGNNQPMITIVVAGTVGTRTKTQTDFNLMTTAVQRIPHYSR